MPKKGDKIWIPCDVSQGPFANERLVAVTSGGSQILAFVSIDDLKDKISTGKTFVLATIVNISTDGFTARLPGHAAGVPEFHGNMSQTTRA